MRWLLVGLFGLAASAASAQMPSMGMGGMSSAPPHSVLPESREQVQLSFAPLVRQAAPAVVNIYTSKTIRTRSVSPLFDDPFFRRFFGDGFGAPRGGEAQRKTNSLGSGVIVSADGLVVTNRHVIEGADDVTVVLADRRELEAKVLGADERSDLAVLRVDNGGEPLPFLRLRDSDTIEVGDLVLAIGNPFGVGQTVTSGIVSALARTQVGISDLNFFIQTDAAINPGNSGGALIALDGGLIGINTAIYSKSGGSIGIGFAIPSNMVRSVVTGLAQGRLVRPWLGAEGQAVGPDIAASLGMRSPTGVLLNEVRAGGPAAQAGLKVGDVVLAVGGKEVNDPQGLRFRFATLPIGSQARLDVLRKGQRLTVSVPVTPPPEDPPREVTEVGGNSPLTGATLANLSPALADELGAEVPDKGVIVLRIKSGSPAHRLRFRPGDVLLNVNGTPVATVRGLKPLFERTSNEWRIAIRRDGQVYTLVIR